MQATSELSILVKMRDEASASMQKLADNMKGVESGMSAAETASKAFAVGMAAVGAAAAAGGYFLVDQAREAAAAQKQLNAVLASTKGVAGVTAEAAKNLSAEMQRLTNFDDEAVLGAENMLLTFTNIKNNVFPQATKTVLDMSAALGQDLKSSAIQLGKALNDPVEGVSALQRVGVTFTESQKEQIKTLVESGKTMEAQKLILKELQTEFGGSAEALASPITQMKNMLADAAETAGGYLLPAVNAVAASVRDFAANVLPVWIANTARAIQFLKEHQWIVASVAGAVVGGLIPAFISLATTIITVTIPAFVAAAVALAPFVIGGALIGGLVAGAMWLIKNWELVKQKTVEIWTSIKDFFVGIWEDIKKAFEGPINWITDKMNSLMSLVNTVRNAAGSVSSYVGGTISSAGQILSGKRASGGPVFGGGAYLVGERGPEIFVPGGSGEIIPNHSLGGGGNVTINITGNTLLDRDSARKIGDLIIKQLKFNYAL